MRFVMALMLAAAAFVIGTVGTRHLPVDNDAGLGVLFVASIFALLGGAAAGWRDARRGMSAARSALRGLAFAALVLALAMVPVVAFLVYCFTPINPNAPCLR